MWFHNIFYLWKKLIMFRTYRGHRILIKLLRFQEGWMANTFSHQILLKVLDMMLNAIQKYYMKKNPIFSQQRADIGQWLNLVWYLFLICIVVFNIYIWVNNSLLFLHGKKPFFYLYPTFFIILKTPLKINCGVIINKLFVSWRHSLNCRYTSTKRKIS